MNDYKKINLACGPKVECKLPEPWLNVDADGPAADMHMDIRQLPTEWQNHFDELRASHVLEHFFLSEVPNILQEWLRVVKPGGLIRIAVPSLSIIIANLYDGKDTKGRKAMSAFQTTPVLAQIYGIGYDQSSTLPQWRHRMLYDEATLIELLEATGQVENIHFYPKSEDPAAQYGILDDSQNIFSMCLSAQKRK